LGNRTWVQSSNPIKIERQTDGGACHLISGLSTNGETFTIIRTNGANSKIEFTNYLIELDSKLTSLREDKKFRESLILAFDNAGIHKSDETKEFLSKRGYTSITVPRYTPDMNPVEKLFAMLKH